MLVQRDQYSRPLVNVDSERYVLQDTIERLIDGGEANWADKLPEDARTYLSSMTPDERSDLIADLKRATSFNSATQREINRARLASVIQQWQTRPGDTDSTQVQIAVISERLSILEDHFKTHRKDKSRFMKRMELLHRRRKLLKYMRRRDFEGFKRCQEFFDISDKEIAWF